jgi:hypothetical protein
MRAASLSVTVQIERSRQSHPPGCGPGKILSATARTSAVVIAGLAGARGELTGLWSGDWTAEVDGEPALGWAVPAQAARMASAKTAIAIAKVPRLRAFLRFITR